MNEPDEVDSIPIFDEDDSEYLDRIYFTEQTTELL